MSSFDSLQWQPLPSLPGMAAVASAGLLSVGSVVSLSLYICVLLRRYYRTPMIQRMEMKEDSRAIKFLTSSHGLLLGNMLVGDFLQAIGFMLNFDWIGRNAFPTATHPTAVCTAQGILIQLGDLGSAFSSLVICVNLFLILVFSIHPSTRLLWGVMAFEWVLITVMSVIGPVALEKTGIPFYGPSGGWCWISASYQLPRLTLHYLWVFTVAFLDLLLYSVMAVKIWHPRRLSGNEQVSGTAGVWRVMMCYPLVYLATIMPLSCYRIASMAGHHWPLHYALAAGTIFTLSGTANVIIYALTRSIVSFESIGSAFRRGSDAIADRSRSCGNRRISGLTSILPSFPFGSGNRENSNSNWTHTQTAQSTTFALNGIRIDVETDISSPELAYSPKSNPTPAFSHPFSQPTGSALSLPPMRNVAGARGTTPTYPVQLRRKSVDGLLLPTMLNGERPFSMLRKLEENEEGAEGEEGLFVGSEDGRSRKGSEASDSTMNKGVRLV